MYRRTQAMSLSAAVLSLRSRKKGSSLDSWQMNQHGQANIVLMFLHVIAANDDLKYGSEYRKDDACCVLFIRRYLLSFCVAFKLVLAPKTPLQSGTANYDFLSLNVIKLTVAFSLETFHPTASRNIGLENSNGALMCKLLLSDIHYLLLKGTEC